MRALLALALMLALPGAAHANLKSCQALYLKTPASLGGIGMSARTDYEKKKRGAGYTVQFIRNDNEVASVFYFDRRQSRFTEKELATELSVSASNIYRLRADGQNVTDGDVFFDRPDPPIKGLFGLAFVHMEFNNRRLRHDYITLGVVDGCLVKLIYSASGPRGRANRKFNRVLDDLLTYVAGPQSR